MIEIVGGVLTIDGVPLIDKIKAALDKMPQRAQAQSIAWVLAERLRHFGMGGTMTQTREEIEDKLADALSEFIWYWIQQDRDHSYTPPEVSDDDE